MPTIHLTIAILLGAAVVVTMLATLAGALGRYSAVVIDRLLLLDLGLLLVVTVSGSPLLIAGGQPADSLHFLYAVLAWVILPVARYMAREGTGRRRGTIMLVGCLVMAGVVARLFMTGA